MTNFSPQSLEKLKTCHPILQVLFHEVVEEYDCTIIFGHRSPEEQNDLFNAGRSQLRGGQSKHNKNPSLAIDVAPFPLDFKAWEKWPRRAELYYFAGYVFGVARKIGIKNHLRWGGDWNTNRTFDDQNFDDLFHFELKLI